MYSVVYVVDNCSSGYNHNEKNVDNFENEDDVYDKVTDDDNKDDEINTLVFILIIWTLLE